MISIRFIFVSQGPYKYICFSYKAYHLTRAYNFSTKETTVINNDNRHYGRGCHVQHAIGLARLTLAAFSSRASFYASDCVIDII